ncbi:enterochelin esterase [Cellulosimicrobium sp. PMB13]|uniref:enterochelin esterase n=1 Tax=Cellulosimicrobium sp. PMB13 TaxID=3120158 RepID=UPI003F4BD78A
MSPATVVRDLRPLLRKEVRGRLSLAAERLCAVVATPAPVGSDAWWDEVARLGTPLRVPGPGTTDLTLFLHRDAHATAVYVDVQPFADRSRLADGLMERVPGTDVWWAAFATGPEWVSGYGFLPLDEVPVAPGARNDAVTRAWWRDLLGRSVHDALNPSPSFRGLRGEARSVARGPRAPRPPALPDGAPRGVLERRAWQRPGTGGTYPVWTYVPPGAAHAPVGSPVAGRSELPLVVLHDGAVWAEQLDACALFDALVLRRSVTPFVAVLVGSPSRDERARDLPGSTAFFDDLADHLLPEVTRDLARRGVRATDDPALTVAAGQSFGGLAALQEVRHRPDRFGNALAQSGSLWWPDLDDESARDVAGWLRAAPPRTGRIVLQVGAHEGTITDANREVRDLLRGRREHVVLTEVDGGHDWAWWHAYLGSGLADVLGPPRGTGWAR